MKTENSTNRERFFEKIHPFLSEDGMGKVSDAYRLAKGAHKGQERDEGVRYFEHPRAVAEIIIDELGIKNDWSAIVLAFLHDVIEDTWLLNYRMVEMCFSKDVASCLALLTREEEHSDEEWEAYLGRIRMCNEWRVLTVKLCDRVHNLRTVKCLSEYRQKRYLDDTEKYFFDFIEKLRACIPQEFAAVPGKVEVLLQKEVAQLKTLLNIMNTREEKIPAVPVPKVGNDIYVPSALYLGHGRDDRMGGLAKVSGVSIEMHGDAEVWFISVEEFPDCGFRWNGHLDAEQGKLRERFGENRAYPDPDNRPEFNEW